VTPRYEVLIVGGGLASARAVKSYREAGGTGRVALVSADRFVPYSRPPLSKRYLRGEVEREGTFVEPPSFYADREVELLLETTVVRVDPDMHAVELADGRRLEYRRLLLATGASPRRLAVPGTDLDGVFTLRTLDDSTRIREAARAAGRAVVLGGSFIGLEVSASLVQLGVEVTLVHSGDVLFDVLRVPELSAFLCDLYRERGVELVLEESVVGFGGEGRVERVETLGGRTLPADLVVQGVGVTPATGFLEGSGIEVENGIVVDERFRTSAPDVHAVGDVARFYDPVLGERRRIEHWSNASYQGQRVGRQLAGEDAPYDTVSSFFSEIFGLRLRVFGDVSPDADLQGSFAGGQALAIYCEDGGVRGALAVGQDDETIERVRAAIRARAPVSAFG
jgi:3-phenylpropionate/trans-cinnamate dioxygenase ferredoxin reductase component